VAHGFTIPDDEDRTRSTIVIDLSNLTKRFGDTLAVDDLNLIIGRGEFFSMLGQNGAGKTTTLKLVAGLLRPTSGTILVAGYDMATNVLDAKKIISFVPDIPYVYEKLTGREFLYFIGELYNLDKVVYRDEAEHLLGLFHMQEYGNQLMESYSHGMKQKVVLCSALLHDPQVIIIDEPMVGLDPKSIRLVKDILRERADEGATIFMSTHTLNLAEEVSDRIGIIHRGQLVGLGTVDEINSKAEGAEEFEDVFLKITAET